MEAPRRSRGRSWLPLAHLQKASEGHQAKLIEPGGGAARVCVGKDTGGHDRGFYFHLGYFV